MIALTTTFKSSTGFDFRPLRATKTARAYSVEHTEPPIHRMLLLFLPCMLLLTLYADIKGKPPSGMAFFRFALRGPALQAGSSLKCMSNGKNERVPPIQKFSQILHFFI